MSETTTTDAVTQGAPQGETASQPENQTAPAPGTEQAPAEQAAKPADDKPAPDPEKTKQDRAIRQAAYEAREAKRQVAFYREELKRLQPAADPNAPPTPADMDRIVNERAEQLVRQREEQTRSSAWIAAGQSEFSDFDERCNQLADMGAAESRPFLAAIGKVPNGHKVIAKLAAEPSEAVRILALSPVDMAVELTLMSKDIAATPAAAPKPTTQAPPPIKPIGGSARAVVDPSEMSGDEFLKHYNAERVKKALSSRR